MTMLMRVASGLQQLVRRAPAVRGERSMRPYIEDELNGAGRLHYLLLSLSQAVSGWAS